MFLIDSTSDMPPKYTFFFSSNFVCLFIYFPIYLYMSMVLLYCYCFSLVFIDQIAKSHIFLSLFSKDPTLGALRDATACYRIFSISNLTLGPRFDFSQTCLSLLGVTFRFFLSYFVFHFKIKKK